MNRAYRNPHSRDRHFITGRDDKKLGTREPRPQPRRQGTRSAVIASHLREY